MKKVFQYTGILMLLFMLFSCRLNKFDKQGNRTGKWKNYWDDKQIQAKGRYKAGWQKGVWKYYDQQGHLVQKQTHHKDKTIDIVYFYPNGHVESKGKARIRVDAQENIHFYWYDQWLFYNANGTLKTEKYYLEGQAMESEEFTK